MPRTQGIRIAILALILLAPAVLHAQTVTPFAYVWGVSLDGWGLDDSGTDVDVGPDGHLYVTGTVNYGGPRGWIGKFTPDGKKTWSRIFSGSAESVAAAPDGSIYVTGTAGGRAYVRKFSAAGCTLWQRCFEGQGTAVAVSTSDGAIYSTGMAAGDIVVRKLTAGGSLLWTRTFDGAARLKDEGRAIVTDAGGNVYVAGSVRRVGQGRNIWLRKYSPAGGTLWTREVRRAGGGDDWANGLRLDSQGNVFVTGSVTYEGAPIFWAGAYSPLGEKLWSRDWVFPQYLQVRGNDVALAANGIVNVIGTGVTPAGTDQPFLMRLQSASGDVVDEYDLDIYPGIATGKGIVALGDGCVFTGGVVYPAGEGGEDILLVRYH